MRTVELHTAWVWDCDECGKENFERSVVAEFGSMEEREEAYRHFHQMAAYEQLPENFHEFECITHPDHVTCRHCQSEFEVAKPDSD